MAYTRLNKAHTHHAIYADDGATDTSYNRYETGMVTGRYRDVPAVIADESGFDGMGFDSTIGSDDDQWHMVNIFKQGGRYIDSLAVGGAYDQHQAIQVATAQLDYLGGDYCQFVTEKQAMQFDGVPAQPVNTWSIDAVNKLMDNPSQDQHYLPTITAHELKEETSRVTFDDVQWDSLNNLVSHGGKGSLLNLDLVRADTRNELVTPFVLADELIDINAVAASFDALMDAASRLPLLKDRLFKAMVQEGKDSEVSVTNVTQTKEFKRQGVINSAFIFDLSDGQTLSIWFHNPDSTPSKLMPSDIMISWKWMLNKRDVTAALSPKNGDNVSLPALASRILRVAAQNSKRFQSTQARNAKVTAELDDAQKDVDDKTATIEQLDTDIDSLQAQLDAAMKDAAAKAAATPPPDEANNNADLPDLTLDNPPAAINNGSVVEGNISVGDPVVWRNEFGEIKGNFRGFMDNQGKKLVVFVSDGSQMNAPQSEVFADTDAPADDKADDTATDAKSTTSTTSTIPIREALEYLSKNVFEGETDRVLMYVVNKDGSITNKKLVSESSKSAQTRYENKFLTNEDTDQVARQHLPDSDAVAASVLTKLGYTVDYSDAEGFTSDKFEVGGVYSFARKDIMGANTSSPDESILMEFEEWVSVRNGSDQPSLRFSTLNGGTGRKLDLSDMQALWGAGKVKLLTAVEEVAAREFERKKPISTYVNSNGRVLAEITEASGLYDIEGDRMSSGGHKTDAAVLAKLQSIKKDNKSMKLKSGKDFFKDVEDEAKTYPPVEYQGEGVYIAYKNSKKKDTWSVHQSGNGDWVVFADNVQTRAYRTSSPKSFKDIPALLATYPAFKGIEALIEANEDSDEYDAIDSSDYPNLFLARNADNLQVLGVDDDSIQVNDRGQYFIEKGLFKDMTLAYADTVCKLVQAADDNDSDIAIADFNATAYQDSMFDALTSKSKPTYGITAQISKDGFNLRARVNEEGDCDILLGSSGVEVNSNVKNDYMDNTVAYKDAIQESFFKQSESDMQTENQARAAAPVTVPTANDNTDMPATSLADRIAVVMDNVTSKDFDPTSIDADALLGMVDEAEGNVALTAELKTLTKIYQRKLVAVSMKALQGLAGDV